MAATIRLADEALPPLLGGRAPRIAVAGLNPHAGEDGLFGDEEGTIIAPADQLARAEGVDVAGPIAADTLFVRALGGEFDAVIAMYHDQGHVALKIVGFDRAVNVTLGLPIVRTSVAHGTAFDIAWSEVRAETTSLIEATRVAARIVAGRRAGPDHVGGVMAGTTVYLLRHGATAANRETPYRLLGRSLNLPLDEEGVEQARRAGKALRRLPLAAVYTSPMLRAVETAARGRLAARPRAGRGGEPGRG